MVISAKAVKIIWCVPCSLVGVLIIFGTLADTRELDRWAEKGTIGKARVINKEKEIEYYGSSKMPFNTLQYWIYIDEDSALSSSSKFVTDDRYRSIKNGDIINVIYFQEDVSPQESTGGLELLGGTVLKVALEDAYSNRPGYYIFGASALVVGWLPFLFRRKKKETD